MGQLHGPWSRLVTGKGRSGSATRSDNLLSHGSSGGGSHVVPDHHGGERGLASQAPTLTLAEPAATLTPRTCSSCHSLSERPQTLGPLSVEVK